MRARAGTGARARGLLGRRTGRSPATGSSIACQVHADLMRPPRSRAGRRGACARTSARRSRSTSQRRAARRCRGSGVWVASVAADGSVDAAGARARMSMDEREVTPLHRAAPDRVLKRLVCLLRARDDEEARRVAVEPVDDARDAPDPARRRHRASAAEPRACRRPSQLRDEPSGPAGLSTTSRCSSSYRTGTVAGRASRPAVGSGISTSTTAPVSSRWLFGRISPSTRTAPSTKSRSARERDRIPPARPVRGRGGAPPAPQRR